MQGTNLFIRKGEIFAYRLYDIAHEINLKKAQALLEQSTSNVRRYQLTKDPLRSVTLRDAPLSISGGEETISIKLNNQDLTFKVLIQLKIWNYGVLSCCYQMEIPDNLSWDNLVLLGSILDADSVIDELATKKRDEIAGRIAEALKNPHTYSVFEDYTTYLIESLEEEVKSKKTESTDQGEALTARVKIKDPIDILKKNCVAELLLAEPHRTLADSTRQSIKSSYSQYTKKDMLIMDWNSALVLDFTKEKEYRDYVDVLEFSLAQLLELRIYDQLLDEKLDELYDSMEEKQYTKVTDFYFAMSEESGRLYMEFSDFFEKLDNSIKTVGDFYLAKVLRSADKKFGFDELKRSMSRKIEALRELSRMCQDKIDSLIEEQRNVLSEKHTKVTHRMEIIVIVLIAIEVYPTIHKHLMSIIDWSCDWCASFGHFFS
jgi:hypothetical protein